MFNEQYLDELLSTPSQALIEDIKKLDGDIMILGAGGKVGPTLSIMAKRAADAAGTGKRVIAVSRFSDPIVVSVLKENGVEMISADLTDPEQVKRLPKVKNIIYMLGRKFGTSGNACDTWMINVGVPTLVTQHFGDANYVVFSTGNIYPFASPASGGNTENVAPAPVGEYGLTCLGRERIFEYAAKHFGAKVLSFRLCYAIDFRYGILSDLCSWILDGEEISLGVPAFNCVWQRYVNECAIRSLLHVSENVENLNITGPETVSVRYAAERLGALLGKKPIFKGEEGEKGILANTGKCIRLFGYPDMGIEEMIEKQAEWTLSGGRRLGKPTHFEEQKGKF